MVMLCVWNLSSRYFNYDFHKTADRPACVFAAGSHWVSFARLAPHIIAVLDTKFGPRASWPDSMATLLRELMRGEHDKECVRLSMQLPANLDLTPAVMQKRLQEMFVPLARAGCSGGGGYAAATAAAGGSATIWSPCSLWRRGQLSHWGWRHHRRHRQASYGEGKGRDRAATQP